MLYWQCQRCGVLLHELLLCLVWSSAPVSVVGQVRAVLRRELKLPSGLVLIESKQTAATRVGESLKLQAGWAGRSPVIAVYCYSGDRERCPES